MSYQTSNQNTIEAYASGLPPVTSLSAASTVSAGTALDGVVVRPNAVMVVNSSAGVSAGAVQLQGSLDGTNWFSLGSAVSTTTASTVFAPVVETGAYVRYVRAAVTTAITGGTVSATVGLHG